MNASMIVEPGIIDGCGDGGRWYCVHALVAKEELAVFELKRQGYVVFRPTHLRPNGKLVGLFPGYFFVQFDPDAMPWRPIFNTPGVIRLLMTGERPAIVPPKAITRIQDYLDTVPNVAEATPLPPVGTMMVANDGPFKGMFGPVARLSGRDRVALLHDLMGRTIEVEFFITQLTAA